MNVYDWFYIYIFASQIGFLEETDGSQMVDIFVSSDAISSLDLICRGGRSFSYKKRFTVTHI